MINKQMALNHYRFVHIEPNRGSILTYFENQHYLNKNM